MKEITDIITAYHAAREQGKQTALATVVQVEGSSYRQPGARMLVTEDGLLTGAISGGCLEGDALRKALYVMDRRQAMLVTYDTNDEDDATLGLGLGCNGIIQVLIEPVDEQRPDHPLQLLQLAAAKRQSSVLVTLFSLTDRKHPLAGTRLLLSGNGEFTGSIPGYEDIFRQEAMTVLNNGRSSFKEYKELSVFVFTEYLSPPVSLVIFGAGNDVMPLVDMAAILGWPATVIDGRPAYATRERFAQPGCRVMVAKPEQALEQLVIDNRTAFILMTHNYRYDMAMLQALFMKEIAYIGLLGPRKKKERILDELREAGKGPSREQLAVLHGPVGLDIGAETPEEIALSVIAEIKAVFAGRRGSYLKETEGTIHKMQQVK